MVLGDLPAPLVPRLVFVRGGPLLPFDLLLVPVVLRLLLAPELLLAPFEPRLVFALDPRLAAVEGRALL